MIGLVARWIAHHPVWVLLGLGAITIFFGVFVPRIGFLSDFKQMLPQDDPAVQRFEETNKIFGSQSVVLVAMAAPEGSTVFNLGTLRLDFDSLLMAGVHDAARTDASGSAR
ncbi:MAG TPA: hypothetical protein ENN53_07015 [Candidatus Acetothermia bacterium]|nr:hypothetical protein [Candidatus Acetothermia bacterium]